MKDTTEKQLRPQSLSDFIGQGETKERLRIYVKSALARQATVDHVLLSGPPGLGKTTLANIVAHEMGTRVIETTGPMMSNKGMIYEIISKLKQGDILFIDEIHRINSRIEEMLYPILEDFKLDARFIPSEFRMEGQDFIPLPLFTVVGATTRPGILSEPFRDRFGITEFVDYYTIEDIKKIVTRSSGLLGIKIDPAGVQAIAERGRGTPRVANTLLKRVRDYALANGAPGDSITGSFSSNSLDKLKVDNLGLTNEDRRILEVIIDRFMGGPVGLSTLAIAVSEDEETVAGTREPYLHRLGLLARTPKGRIVTKAGTRHMLQFLPEQR